MGRRARSGGCRFLNAVNTTQMGKRIPHEFPTQKPQDSNGQGGGFLLALGAPEVLSHLRSYSTRGEGERLQRPVVREGWPVQFMVHHRSSCCLIRWFINLSLRPTGSLVACFVGWLVGLRREHNQPATTALSTQQLQAIMNHHMLPIAMKS